MVSFTCGKFHHTAPSMELQEHPTKVCGAKMQRTTYSLTLWVCNGCKKGLCAAAGVVPSETDCDGGRDMTARRLAGLKSPGETGVLLAAREGD